MSRRLPPLDVDQHDPLVLEIQAILEEDLASGAKLMQPEYRSWAIEQRSLNGYCAAAVAAYFHLGGGREADLQPMQHTDRHDNRHWWIRKADGRLVDLIYRPHETPTYRYYRRGVPRGFTNCGYVRVPKRAQAIIDRVVARRGSDDDGGLAERVRLRCEHLIPWEIDDAMIFFDAEELLSESRTIDLARIGQRRVDALIAAALRVGHKYYLQAGDGDPSDNVEGEAFAIAGEEPADLIATAHAEIGKAIGGGPKARRREGAYIAAVCLAALHDGR